MNKRVALAANYINDRVVVACARAAVERYWQTRWHGSTDEVDLLGVVWAELQDSTDSQRTAELERALKVLRKLGLIRTRKGRAVLGYDSVDLDAVAEGIAAELNASNRSEATKHEIIRSFAMPALLGGDPNLIVACWSGLEGKHLRLGYLCGEERAARAADCM